MTYINNDINWNNVNVPALTTLICTMITFLATVSLCCGGI